MEYKRALKIAEHYVDLFAPHCERIQIAGSIRRKKPQVKDIEIVAEPRIVVQKDMFGYVVAEVTALDPVFASLQENGEGLFIKNGNRYKQIQLMGPGMSGIKLDLFLVLPPAQWGVILMIRTGPAEFSRRIVSQKFKGGLLPDHLWVEEGMVQDGTSYYTMPEEEDYFRVLGIAPTPPELRS